MPSLAVKHSAALTTDMALPALRDSQRGKLVTLAGEAVLFPPASAMILQALLFQSYSQQVSVLHDADCSLNGKTCHGLTLHATITLTSGYAQKESSTWIAMTMS